MNRKSDADFDAIALEVFRSRLQAVAEEGAVTIAHRLLPDNLGVA
jgi:hypothetical protein